ncbi:MAG TPA: hypothetical protein VIL79_09225 [Thermoleophilia bacterium]
MAADATTTAPAAPQPEPDGTAKAGAYVHRPLVPSADVVALGAALLAYVMVHGGLFGPEVAPAVQAGVIVGIVAAFSATAGWRAAVAAGAAGVIGGLLLPVASGGSTLVATATVAVVAALVAIGARWAVDRGAIRKQLVVMLGMAIIIGNLWLSTATLDSQQVVIEGQTMFQFMVSKPQPDVLQPDQVFYKNIVQKMRAGTNYYDAWRQAYHENAVWGRDPSSAISVRQPLLLSVLAALPGDGRSPIWLMTLVASIAVILSMAMVRGLHEHAIALVSAAAVASFALNFTTLPFVFGFEPWGGLLAVIAVSLFAQSHGGKPEPMRRRLLIASAVIAVLAVAVRELMLFLPLAGIVAAFFAPKPQRRFDLTVWIGALVTSAVALGAHVLAAQRIISPGPGLEQWLGRGSIDNLTMGLVNGAKYISTSYLVLVALAFIGIGGALLARDRQYRAFLIVAIFVPLVGFLFAYNGAIDQATGKVINYWGPVITPVVYAMVPAILLAFTPKREAGPVPAGPKE